MHGMHGDVLAHLKATHRLAHARHRARRLVTQDGRQGNPKGIFADVDHVRRANRAGACLDQ